MIPSLCHPLPAPLGFYALCFEFFPPDISLMHLQELPSFTSKRAVPDAALNKLVDKAKNRALSHAGEMQEDASGAGVGEYLDEGEDAGGASGDEPES
jgi:hypothetical protein